MSPISGFTWERQASSVTNTAVLTFELWTETDRAGAGVITTSMNYAHGDNQSERTPTLHVYIHTNISSGRRVCGPTRRCCSCFLQLQGCCDLYLTLLFWPFWVWCRSGLQDVQRDFGPHLNHLSCTNYLAHETPSIVHGEERILL